MANLFLDLELGSDAASGTSYANRVKTLARASALALPGDTVRIMANTTPNSLGTNGTFAKGSPTITLASALTTTVSDCQSAWTASANVTTTTSTTRKAGAVSTSIAIAAGFTTGLAAFKLTPAMNYSARQQLSFWFQQTAGTLSGFDIKLCTDAVGAVATNTFSIPAAVVLNGWNRVTINLGSAMSAVIVSVAMYVTADNGAQTYIFSNMEACNAPGTGELTHKTLIGKQKSLGAGGDDSETWYAIRGIEGTTVTLDLLNSSNAGSTTNGRYWGVSETVTAYSLFPSYVPTSVVSADLQWTAGGTDTQTLTISGGWDRTAMTTLTGQTWIAMAGAASASLSWSWTASYLTISRFNLFMPIVGFNLSGSVGTTITGIHQCNVNSSNISLINGSMSSGSIANCTQVLFTGNASSYEVSVLSDNCTFSFANSLGCTINLGGTCVAFLFAASPTSKLIFNGTTYGSFGEASTAAAVMASTGDTGVTLTKALEMLAAFKAGKVSVSSAGGISTYSYMKRDGTTVSFTALCSETDGTRATTGALS